VCAIDGAHQGYGPLLDQRFEVDIVNGGEGEIEQVAGQGRYGGEVSVEEDGVQNRCAHGLAVVYGESGRMRRAWWG
jgi:hypothetical protein